MPQSVIDAGSGLYDIEYTGPIPRSMKNEEAQGTSLWVGELAGLSPTMPAILDNVNVDELARGLGFARGVPATYMNDEDQITQIRDKREEERKEAMAMQQLEQVAKAGKDLSQMDMGDEAAA